MNRALLTLTAGLLLGAAACQVPVTQPGPGTSANPNPFPMVSPSAPASPNPTTSPSASIQPTTQPSAIPPAPPLDGLVAYYAFEGNADSHDHRHDGRTTEGTLLFEEGLRGKSAFFPYGSPIFDVGIYFDSKSGVELGREFTISIWSNTALPNTQKLSMPLLCGIRDKQWGIGLFWTPGGPEVFINKDQPNEFWLRRNQSPRPETQENKWHHTAITYNSKTLNIYLDGKQEVSQSVPLTSSDYGIIDEIGKCAAVLTETDPLLDNRFQGHLDELRVYSRVLSDSEIQALTQFDGENDS